MRSGVLFVGSDPLAAAFLASLLEDDRPNSAPLLALERADVSLAAIAGTRRRRLVIVDGEPPDWSTGKLVEAIGVADPDLPVLVIRYGARGAMSPGPHQVNRRIVVRPGPLVRATTERIILDLLDRSPL